MGIPRRAAARRERFDHVPSSDSISERNAQSDKNVRPTIPSLAHRGACQVAAQLAEDLPAALAPDGTFRRPVIRGRHADSDVQLTRLFRIASFQEQFDINDAVLPANAKPGSRVPIRCGAKSDAN